LQIADAPSWIDNSGREAPAGTSALGKILRLRSGQVSAAETGQKKSEGANALRRLRPLNRAVNFRLPAPRARLPARLSANRCRTESALVTRASTTFPRLPCGRRGWPRRFPIEARSLRAFRSGRRAKGREAPTCVVAEPPSLRNLFIRFSAARAVRPVRLRTGPLSPGASRASLASQAPCGACDF